MKRILSFVFAFVLLAGISCVDKADKADLKALKSKHHVEEHNKEVILKYWEGKWNDRRPEILDESQTPDVVYHGTSMNMNGLDEYKAVYQSYLSALHDTHIEIEELIAEGDRVVSRCLFTGVHAGELEGLPPTGKTIQIQMFTVFRLVNGKIAEEWEIMDELGFMLQLGMEHTPKEPAGE